MNKFIKRASAFLLCAVMMITSAVFVSAAEVESAEIEETTINAAITPPDAEIQADEIVWKTRIYNGQLQKRRWNKSKGIWVDPDWIDC